MFLERAMPGTNSRRSHPPLKFATLNNFEHSAQFIGQKITLGILIQPPMVL